MDGDMESELYRSGGILSVGEPFSLAGDKEEQLKNLKGRNHCDGTGFWGWQCLRCPLKRNDFS